MNLCNHYINEDMSCRKMYCLLLYNFFFFGLTHVIQKFWVQGSNLRHSIDNARSLNRWATRELNNILDQVLSSQLGYPPVVGY